MKEIYAICGVIAMLVCMLPYIVALYHKRAKPHAFSWLLWGFINLVVLAAQSTEGAGAGAWVIATNGTINTLLGLYALKYGERHFTKSDWAVFLVALSAIPLWWVTKDPWWSVLLVSFIDVVAFYPTLRKSWNKPHEEVAMTFVIGGVGFVFSLLALDNYNLVNSFYPVVVLAVNTVFISLLLYRRRVMGVA